VTTPTIDTHTIEFTSYNRYAHHRLHAKYRYVVAISEKSKI